LVWSIIQIRHFPLRSQFQQDIAKLRRAVCIFGSTQGHDTPEKLRMGEYVATAPEYLVVRVGNDNSSFGPGS
jgi:hypothetical protein